MTNGEPELDEECEEELGPSQAIPPLYVLRAPTRCPECGKAQHVYGLGCAAFCDAYEGETLDAFHFLRQVRGVPEELVELLNRKCPSFSLEEDARTGERYFMNHCACGVLLYDDFTHGDVGAPFWPDTPEGFGYLTLFEIPIAEAIAVECTYTIGSGEYLNVAGAGAW